MVSLVRDEIRVGTVVFSTTYNYYRSFHCHNLLVQAVVLPTIKSTFVTVEKGKALPAAKPHANPLQILPFGKSRIKRSSVIKICTVDSRNNRSPKAT